MQQYVNMKHALSEKHT